MCVPDEEILKINGHRTCLIVHSYYIIQRALPLLYMLLLDVMRSILLQGMDHSPKSIQHSFAHHAN
jgi:hypothetical protein